MLKNYLFILIWILYFIALFIFKTTVYYKEIITYSIYFEYVLSVLSGIFALILSFYSLNIFIKKFDFYWKKITSKTKTKYDFLVLELVVKFLDISKYIVSIYIALNIAIIPDKLQDIVDKIFNVSFIVAFLFLITTFIKTIFKEIAKKQDNSSLSQQVFPILNKVIIVFIWIIWIITIVWNLGYNISALITWAWVWWLAIALAAQKSVANIFWAISVIINRPFSIWDFVKIWWFTWVVKDIWLTYLKLSDLNWHDILIPNENIISSSVENYSARMSRRCDLSIWLTYDTDIEKLKKWVKIIEDILESYTWEKDDDKIISSRVNFDSFWDFSLNINVTYFSRITDYKEFLKLKEEINLKIKEEFEKAWINMAFPTQTLYIEWNVWNIKKD